MSVDETRAAVARLVDDWFDSLGLTPPDAARNLRDAGLSSLQLVELIFRLEDMIGARIPEALVTPENFESKLAIVATLTSIGVSRAT